MKCIARNALLLSLLAGSIGVAGCGQKVLDQEKAEALIADNVTVADAPTRTVSCPADVESKRGESFRCSATFENGRRATITIHIKTDEGDVRFEQRDIVVE